MISVYTDGSAKSNGTENSRGGWAYVVIQDGQIIHQNSGFSSQTTNQRMELTACLEALKYCATIPFEEFCVYSDSAYLINCYKQEWYINWEKNGWYNSQRKPVANQDLWEQIIPFFRSKYYHFNKVKGHANNQFNNLVDNMAQSAAGGKDGDLSC